MSYSIVRTNLLLTTKRHRTNKNSHKKLIFVLLTRAKTKLIKILVLKTILCFSKRERYWTSTRRELNSTTTDMWRRSPSTTSETFCDAGPTSWWSARLSEEFPSTWEEALWAYDLRLQHSVLTSSRYLFLRHTRLKECNGLRKSLIPVSACPLGLLVQWTL